MTDDAGRGGFSGQGSVWSPPPEKVGLWMFMGVVTVLFSLFIEAYFIRMKLGDWQSLPETRQLWLNTALLALSSIALQFARVAARRGQADRLKIGLAAGGTLAFAFLGGQFLVWQQLTSLGYFVAGNPANSFFYLITGLHGLHLLGGLVVWGKTTRKVWRGVQVSNVRLSMELTATYWHFLLVVWLVLFSVLGSPEQAILELAAICGLR
jgi:cytochrome c oxidase subunit 3